MALEETFSYPYPKGERIVIGNSYSFSLNALYLGKPPLGEAQVP